MPNDSSSPYRKELAKHAGEGVSLELVLDFFFRTKYPKFHQERLDNKNNVFYYPSIVSKRKLILVRQ